MKNSFFKTVAIILVLTALLSGCSKQGSAGKSDFIMSTGRETGTYFSFGRTISALMEKYNDGVKVTVLESEGSRDNLAQIADKTADLAIVQGDLLWYAQNGKEMFKGSRLTGISPIASLYPEYIQIVVPAESEIYSIEDLMGKRVAVGSSGTAAEVSARNILAAYDMDYDDITVKYQSFTDSANALRHGNLDAAFVTAGAPGSSVLSLSEQMGIRLLPISDLAADKLIRDFGFYYKGVIPSYVYDTDEDCPAMAICTVLVCRSSLSDGDVYKLTSAVFDNLDELSAANAKGAEVFATNAKRGVVTDLHPGAKQYFSGE